MTGSLRGLSRCPGTYLAISRWHWVWAHALHHAARLTAAHWLRPGVLCSWRRYSRLYTAGTHVLCALYTVQLYAPCYCFQDLLEVGGPQRRGAHLGRKMEVERYQIQDKCNVEGLYKHIWWCYQRPGGHRRGRGTQRTLTCVTCHYHWFVICLYLTTSRTLNHCAHFKVNGIIGVYTRRHLL